MKINTPPMLYISPKYNIRGFYMIADKIKLLRKQNKWTQEDLAKKLGIKQPQLNRWETGDFQPSLNILKKMSKIFNVSIDALVFDDKDLNKLTLEDKSILDKLKGIGKLNEKEKEMVLNLINTLAEKKD